MLQAVEIFSIMVQDCTINHIKTLLIIYRIFKTFRWTVFRVRNIHYVNKKISIQYNIYDTDTSKD